MYWNSAIGAVLRAAIFKPNKIGDFFQREFREKFRLGLLPLAVTAVRTLLHAFETAPVHMLRQHCSSSTFLKSIKMEYAKNSISATSNTQRFTTLTTPISTHWHKTVQTAMQACRIWVAISFEICCKCLTSYSGSTSELLIVSSSSLKMRC